MADKKKVTYGVFFKPHFGAKPLQWGAGLTRAAADKYVADMQEAQPGEYEVKPE